MLYGNSTWIPDIDKVIEVVPELDELAGKSLMITGAAGLVCSAIVDIIFRYNDTHDKKIQVLAAGRWPEEMSGRFGDLVNRDDFTFVVYDASKTDNVINVHSDYIIHGASNASPNMIVKEPVETMMSNFLGMKYLLDYAKVQGTKRILYISSSEVYGEKEGSEPYKEGQYGYIDLLKSRNSYSVGKRAAETLCASYADEYGMESVIVRPGHIYGPTASPYDNRVASAWSYAVAKGEDIVMKSDGSQIRSYCYCLDCASAILTALLNGNNGEAYNISSKDIVCSIRDIAEALARAGNVKVVFENASETEKKGFNMMDNSSLNGTKMETIGWHPLYNINEGCEKTLFYYVQNSD